MNKHPLFRAVAVALVLAAAVTASQAFIPKPVTATAISFTSSSTQSSVLVVVSNPNTVTLYGNLTLVVDQANGVPRTWPAGRITIPYGNSTHRVLIPGAITGVRWARITNLGI